MIKFVSIRMNAESERPGLLSWPANLPERGER